MASLKETLQARHSLQTQRGKILLDTIEREQRGFTSEEAQLHASIVADLKDIGNHIGNTDRAAANRQEMEAELGRVFGDDAGRNGQAGSPGSASRQGRITASIGEQFLKSDTFEWLKKTARSRPSGAWSSPSSELMATTLTEDPASGGDLVIPQYLPGIVPSAMRPLRMADLIAAGVTESNQIVYMKETAYTNSADTVAEGAAKPESALTFAAVSDKVAKIAHWLPVTEEMLEDVVAVKSYIDSRLRLGADTSLDDQLLNGSGVAPDIAGFLARAGLAASIARGSDTNADAILKQVASVEHATGLAVDGIVLNPTNWLTILLTKDADGNYIGGAGPFASPRQPTLWGRNVAVTSVIVANTALVGCFQTAAQLFRRGGLRVEASNSHSDFFVKNLVAIRAELRAALCVYRPAAFGTVTSLT